MLGLMRGKRSAPNHDIQVSTVNAKIFNNNNCLNIITRVQNKIFYAKNVLIFSKTFIPFTLTKMKRLQSME